jgi:hypothetical protein
MTARDCFTGKVASGTVDRRAGDRLLQLLDDFTEHHKATLGDAAAMQRGALDAAQMVIEPGQVRRRPYQRP